jgi:hypothetical protein
MYLKKEIADVIKKFSNHEYQINMILHFQLCHDRMVVGFTTTCEISAYHH